MCFAQQLVTKHFLTLWSSFHQAVMRSDYLHLYEMLYAIWHQLDNLKNVK